MTRKVQDWFSARAGDVGGGGGGSGALPPGLARIPGSGADVRSLRVGLLTSGGPSAALPPAVVLLAAALVHALASGGGSCVLPATAALLHSPIFRREVLGCGVEEEGGLRVPPSLAFGQAPPPHGPPPASAGLHIMDMPAVVDPSETLTGLAATGAHIVLLLSCEEEGSARAHVAPGHPLVPVLHLAATQAAAPSAALAAAADAVLTPPTPGAPLEDTLTLWLGNTLRLLARTAGGHLRPKSAGAVFFSITRGHVGVST